MKRRDFFQKGSLGLASAGLFGSSIIQPIEFDFRKGKKPKNIIFMVSDGMSTGTLNMANLLRKQMEGVQSHWLELYEQRLVSRALMDMASASSFITDSAAASSSWGGGVRVKNGSLNTNTDGTPNKPILQKFKNSGKAVGCVTTVPITHATPAGFSISNNKRGDQEEIALQYLPLKFDIMMGGGDNYFNAEIRKDKQDVYKMFAEAGYEILRNRSQMMATTATIGKPVLGVFHKDGLPYSLDRRNSESLTEKTPTLAEMANTAIQVLKQNPKGFVLQIEAGRVDWAAHANDSGGILYDQLAFDDTIKVAIDFAKADKNTLVVITSDHGNANPGLFYGEKANKNFDKIQNFKQTNDWFLNGLSKNSTVGQIIERHEATTGFAIKQEEAKLIQSAYVNLSEEGTYNAYKLPYKTLGQIQSNYTSVSWAGIDHSADYVELAMYGPGSEKLKPFVKNTELHNFLLEAAEVNDLVKI
jgi:alkaline phosphatase